MLRRLKILFTYFSLLVFLFPQVTEEIHAFQHRNDKHCTERNAVHLHEFEHGCFICYYVPQTADEQAAPSFITQPVWVLRSFAVSHVTPFRDQTQIGYALRGPPAIA
ncbi:MAG TPA: hypothetical protein PKE06_20725 [Flavilitoribacter sp.]|nr:hypothetical protein [Flavilitoribacter sp.]HMQ87140.1 hypothetical protein [Flavilitoribacter sp.]